MAKGSSATLPGSIIGDENAVILQARNGDSEAFSRLYDAYVERIYRFILYRVNDDQTAGDLTSQVFIRAWQNLDRYQPRGHPFSAWLFQISRNLLVDHYRARREVVSLDDDLPDIQDPSTDVAGMTEEQLQAEWVRAALQKVTPEQRQVLMLKFLDGLSTDEIASLMGKRAGAVRALQLRGLKLLSRIMRVEDEPTGSHPG